MSGVLGTTLSGEKCLIGFDQKSIQFICCRSVIALKTRIRYGPRNGDTKLSLALSVATKQVFAYSLITPLICRFKNSLLTPLVNNKEIKLSQYADDTTLTLDGSKKSLVASLEMLDDFYEVSGLRLNDTKTEAFWIGSNCGKDPIQFPGRNFKWPRYKVKALGVWFSIDPEETVRS